MSEFHERRRLKRLLYSVPTLVALSLILLLFIKGTWNIYTKERESRAARSQAATELASARDRYEALATQMERLASPEGVEAQLRSKYGVAKEGEKVIVIVDKQPETPTTTPEESGGVWNWLFGWF